MSINTSSYHALNRVLPCETTSIANSLTVPSSSQASESLAGKRITWIHGTNSLTLEQMRYTDCYTLKATGKLIQDRMVPFTGELFCGGMSFFGVNQKKICGIDGSIGNAYAITWSYATSIGNREFIQFESHLINNINEILADIQIQGLLPPNQAIFLTIYILQLRQWNAPLYQSLYSEQIELIKNLALTLGEDIFLDEIDALRKAIACQVQKEPDLTGEQLSQIIEKNFGFPADWVNIDSHSSLDYQFEDLLEGYTYLWNKENILSHILGSNRLCRILKRSERLCRISESEDRSLYSAIIALKNHKPDLFFSKMKEIEQAFLEVEQEVNLVRENLLKALSDEPLPIQLDEEGRKKWQNIVAFPLLMASCQGLKGSSGFGVAIEQPLQLGKEIEILATDEAHIDELRKFVQDYLPGSVRVYTNEEIKSLFVSSQM
ncbi:MAG TPA: hypothetical protein VGZ69_00560 [Candidatus Rhabdochlamydia sp.]|jgi:hypothetical protein|nr:hypothetical protein [Candidatus Rhabdochlamydia sp.]